ncbi:hypothetical protein JKP88DRAFT_233656 [Tribonema minus]|uniref:Transmembrane protein n=1 Tax=Tribonema minus TaxID=303371 RepID=A0A836CKP5_9STRA|nr:hypothetical protein JKP88DRAFT_233656 [Tribonema minus]
MRDCRATWVAYKWGVVDSSAEVPATTGAELLHQLPVNWVNISDSAVGLGIESGRSTNMGTGFSGYAPPRPTDIHAAAESVLRLATGSIGEQLVLEVAKADETLTWTGSLVVLSTTLVAVLATYAGRKDIQHIVLKATPLCLAKSAVVLASLVAVALPAVMVAIGEVKARGNNPDGTTAAISWVYADAAVDNGYRLVAAVSTTFTAEYDAFAWVLVWVNLAVSLVATVIIAYVVLQLTPTTLRSKLPVLARRATITESQQPRRSHSTNNFDMLEEVAPCV